MGGILTEYREAARQGGREMITVEYVDPYSNPRRAAEIARTFHVDQPNLVIFTNGRRHRVVTAADIMQFEDMVPTLFTGEQAFTSAILETSSKSTSITYFTTGHGEMAIDDVSPVRGLSQIAGELRARNIEPRPLDLSSNDVPADASLIVIADPQGRFLPEETTRLRNYLDERAGRLVVYLGAGRDTNIETFLSRWGIDAADVIVCEKATDCLDSAGGLIVRNFADSPLTGTLRNNSAPILAGQARPMLASRMAATPGTRVTLLMASSALSWGERGWRTEKAPVFNSDLDMPGPIPLAALAQTGAGAGTGITLPGARILAVGLGDAISNNRFSAFGNQAFFFSTINWMLDRGEMLAIEPHPIARYQLPLSREELARMPILLCIPASVVLLMGIIIGISRRY